MTDLKRFPDAVPAVWSSGSPTEAMCDAAFFNGSSRSPRSRAPSCCCSPSTPAGKVTSVAVPPELDDKYGRLRAARTGPDGSLYITTSNGADDKLLRITRS